MGEEDEVEAGTAELEWWLWLIGEILVTKEPAFANGLSELPVNRVAKRYQCLCYFEVTTLVPFCK